MAYINCWKNIRNLPNIIGYNQQINLVEGHQLDNAYLNINIPNIWYICILIFNGANISISNYGNFIYSIVFKFIKMSY